MAGPWADVVGKPERGPPDQVGASVQARCRPPAAEAPFALQPLGQSGSQTPLLSAQACSASAAFS